MLCETTCLDNEGKDIDNISSNCLINLRILTTNTEEDYCDNIVKRRWL